MGSYLKRRGHTWYVQLAVPSARQRAVGAKVLVKSLGTRDRDEANRLKHAVLADLQALIAGDDARARGPNVQPERTAEDVLRLALDERAAVEAGADPEQSEAGFDAMVDNFLNARAKVLGRDEAGNPRLPEPEHALVRRAYKALSGRLELTLGNRIAAYLAEQPGRLTAQTIADKRRRLEEFGKWLGMDLEVAEVTRADAGRYVAEVIQKRTTGPAEAPQAISPTTKKKEVSDLRSFFDWLVARGSLDTNPFDRMSSTVKGSTRGRAAARRPWAHDELATVLHGFAPNDPLWSLTAIGAYTGMRREEIAELRVTDVDGDVLRISQGKTAAAVRRVPIHPSLSPLVRQLAASSPDGYLIPGLLPGGPDNKRAWYVGKRFGYAIRKLGITDPALDFHALRSTVITKLEEAGTPESTIKLIVGHRRKGMTLGVYSGGLSDQAKRVEVEKLSYGREIDKFVSQTGGRVAIELQSKPRTRISML